jgi:hypothetical protein
MPDVNEERQAEERRRAAENMSADSRTPHDVPTVRVKNPDKEGDYMLINRKDYDPNKHELIKGGENQEQGLYAGASERNPSGTFSEPTPTDIRFPNKDATEFENNHGAFVRKSAAQMREDHGLEDAPGGLYPMGAMRIEPVSANSFRVMSGTREVVGNVSAVDAQRFSDMSDSEKEEWVRSKGGNPPNMEKAREEVRQRQSQPGGARQPASQPGTRIPNRSGQGQGQPGGVSPGQPPIGQQRQAPGQPAQPGQPAPSNPSGNKQ